MSQEQPTLHEALRALGWRSAKERDEQRRTVYDTCGRTVGSFTAAELWAYLETRNKEQRP
jgi:hypothetical protein